MKIAIIGSGNVGGALATQWAQAGHQIYLGLRDLNNFKGTALLSNPSTSIHSIKEATKQAEVILVATPPQFAESLAATFGHAEHKIIIDATNAIRTKPANYPTAYHALADLTKAELVKCFNSTGFENMQQPQYEGMSLDMFMAGDSTKAKKIATQLSSEAGFANCYDFGSSDKVVLLEQFALSWINLAIMQGMGRAIGFKLLKR